ncbi:STAS domain-containing protein [bacterium]|nr:STAS domain-containing protein [candidate division CSSED10-310 bacterium]
MKIKRRERDDVIILDFSGEITIGKGDVELRKEISDLVFSEKKKILLNLRKVDFIDSSGIGEIVRSFTTIQKNGGVLKLLHLEAKVRDLFTITRLITVFETFENEKDAVDSFKD